MFPVPHIYYSIQFSFVFVINTANPKLVHWVYAWSIANITLDRSKIPCDLILVVISYIHHIKIINENDCSAKLSLC